MTQAQKNMIKTWLLDKFCFLFCFLTNKVCLQKGTSKIKLYPSIACHGSGFNYMQKQQ